MRAQHVDAQREQLVNLNSEQQNLVNEREKWERTKVFEPSHEWAPQLEPKLLRMVMVTTAIEVVMMMMPRIC